MVDAPVVVRTLVDREDLILEGVAVVTDDAELDVDGHFTWFGILIPKPKNR